MNREPELGDPLIHQAEGALAAVLRVPVDEAAMILRVRAHDRGLPLSRLATEVLAPLATPADPNIAGSC